LRVGIRGRPEEADAGQDAPDVRVDREIRFSEREQHDDPRRFAPDARGGEEPVHRGVEVHRPEEREVELASLAVDALEDLADPGGLLPVEAPDPKGSTDRVDGGRPDRVEGTELPQQGRERSVAIRVVRVLGEDRQDERLDRVRPDDGRGPVVFGEPIGESHGSFARFHGGRIDRGPGRRNWRGTHGAGTMVAR